MSLHTKTNMNFWLLLHGNKVFNQNLKKQKEYYNVY